MIEPAREQTGTPSYRAGGNVYVGSHTTAMREWPPQPGQHHQQPRCPSQAKNREPEAKYAQLDSTGESQSKLIELEPEILGLHAGMLTLRNTSKNHPLEKYGWTMVWHVIFD